MNKTTNLFLILLLFRSLFGFGQGTSHFHLADLVSAYITELRSKGADTVCVYEAYSFGDEYLLPDDADSCAFENVYVSTYLIWKKEGKTFLTKKDNCFDYSVIEISPDFWYPFLSNRAIIKTETLKPFEYRYYDKKQKRSVVSELSYEHSIHRDFKVIISHDTTAMEVNLLTMQQKSIDRGQNLNYSHNTYLKSKAFIDQLSILTEDIEDKKRLSKTRR